MSNNAEINYKDGEWPEVVVVFLTWAGPPDRKIDQIRLEYARRAILFRGLC